MSPTLTACIPNYNHARYLPDALTAVLGQARRPDEFLVLDDASTDDSVAVIESLAARDPLVTLVRNERNRGVVASLDRLLRLAKSDYVYFGAADDYVLPGFFAGALAQAERCPQAGIIFGQVAIRPAELPATAPAPEVRGVSVWPTATCADPETFLREYMAREPTWHSPTHATVYRREAFLEVGGFRAGLGHLSDTFALRVLGRRWGACYVPEPWATWRITERSYAASEGRDALKMLDLAANLEALMRAPEFRDLFPESFARRWETDLHRLALEHYILGQRARYGCGPAALWRGRLLKRWLRLVVRLRYHGDITAFLRAEVK